MEVRRQALKLRFWGERHNPNGLLDLTYERIKSLSGAGLYELRIDDEIGGHRNIRIVFLGPPNDWTAQNWTRPLPVVWILDVLPKRRNDWTGFDIDRFQAKRAIVKERFY